MRAIKLKQENLALIQTQCPSVRRSDLEAMMKHYDSKEIVLYFVPDFEDETEGFPIPYGIIKAEIFDLHYECDDMTDIHHKFVEIRRKRD